MAEKTYTPAAAMVRNNGDDIQLETSRSERHVWLMKCPPVVSRAMQHQHKPPPPPFASSSVGPAPSVPGLAKVIVTVDPLLPYDDSSTQFTMELTDTSGNIPKTYSMNMSTDVIPMSVFSEASQGKLCLEGKIYHKFDMKPHNENMEDYARICRERTNKYKTKTRQIQVIEDNNGMRMMRPMMVEVKSPGVTMDYKRKAPVKASDTKRTRRDAGEMEKILFNLFERQPNWTLKQLVQETDQPEQFMKDMLKSLCVYNNKGANQGTYELKPEYKKSEDKSLD